MSKNEILFVNKNGASETLLEVLKSQAVSPPLVISADSQEVALAHLREDISLVVLDAYQVEHHLIIRRLQEFNANGSSVKLLVILPDQDPGEDPIWIALADGILRKPFNIHALENRVKSLLGCECACRV